MAEYDAAMVLLSLGQKDEPGAPSLSSPNAASTSSQQLSSSPSDDLAQPSMDSETSHYNPLWAPPRPSDSYVHHERAVPDSTGHSYSNPSYDYYSYDQPRHSPSSPTTASSDFLGAKRSFESLNAKSSLESLNGSLSGKQSFESLNTKPSLDSLDLPVLIEKGSYESLDGPSKKNGMGHFETSAATRTRLSSPPEELELPIPYQRGGTRHIIHVGANVNKKPYACSNCGRAFARREHLMRHIETMHHGQKDFKCQVCSRVFSRKDNMMQHVRNKHGKKGSPQAMA